MWNRSWEVEFRSRKLIGIFTFSNQLQSLMKSKIAHLFSYLGKQKLINAGFFYRNNSSAVLCCQRNYFLSDVQMLLRDFSDLETNFKLTCRQIFT